jgi:hypothetical protein
MSLKGSFAGSVVPVIALALAVGTGAVQPAQAKAQDYRFELAGKPEVSGGKDIVRVRLVHLSDGKPVPGAVIFESRADMGPMGMPTMTGPIKAMPSKEPGIYSFEIEPGMAGTWAITLAAKVQGETETVHGAVNAELTK